MNIDSIIKEHEKYTKEYTENVEKIKKMIEKAVDPLRSDRITSQHQDIINKIYKIYDS
tara:strand:+ start:319 stop:492 length:174 start_codon:yes stop_codon:yes gene_type:complete